MFLTITALVLLDVLVHIEQTERGEIIYHKGKQRVKLRNKITK